eukprot:359309-Chlamydomonas_euryale.AAC.5
MTKHMPGQAICQATQATVSHPAMCPPSNMRSQSACRSMPGATPSSMQSHITRHTKQLATPRHTMPHDVTPRHAMQCRALVQVRIWSTAAWNAVPTHAWYPVHMHECMHTPRCVLQTSMRMSEHTPRRRAMHVPHHAHMRRAVCKSATSCMRRAMQAQCHI